MADARQLWGRLKDLPEAARKQQMAELRALVTDVVDEEVGVEDRCREAGATISRVASNCAGWQEDGGQAHAKGCGLTFPEQREMLLPIADVMRGQPDFERIGKLVFFACDPGEY